MRGRSQTGIVAGFTIAASVGSMGLAGCSVCTEQVSLSITNASPQPVRVVVAPMDDKRLEVIQTVLPPGGHLHREVFQVRCGMGPKMTASTISSEPVAIETTFTHDRGSVRIIGTPAGGLGIEFPNPVPAQEAAR